MTATVSQAKDEILAQYRTTWLADSTSVDVPIHWWNVRNQKPPTSGAWARITVQHAFGGQPTVGKNAGARRYRRTGLVTVEIWTPSGDSTLADALSMIALSAFEGKRTSPGGVWFRNVRPNEIGQDGVWFKTNVLADFVYDEVR